MSAVEDRKTIPHPMPEGDPEVVAGREKLVAECLAAVRRRPVRTADEERSRLQQIAGADVAQRLAEFDRLFRELSTMTGEGDTEESWAEFERNIDEERRLQGMRTIFEGRRKS